MILIGNAYKHNYLWGFIIMILNSWSTLMPGQE